MAALRHDCLHHLPRARPVRRTRNAARGLSSVRAYLLPDRHRLRHCGDNGRDMRRACRRDGHSRRLYWRRGLSLPGTGNSAQRVSDNKKASQSLPPAGGKKFESHFLSRHVRERKYFSVCQCGICPPLAGKLCAQQTASLLSEKNTGFFDSLKKMSLHRLIFCTYMRFLRLYAAVGVEQRELCKIDDVAALRRVALGKRGHTPGDDAARLRHQRLQRVKGFAGGDNVVH